LNRNKQITNEFLYENGNSAIMTNRYWEAGGSSGARKNYNLNSSNEQGKNDEVMLVLENLNNLEHIRMCMKEYAFTHLLQVRVCVCVCVCVVEKGGKRLKIKRRYIRMCMKEYAFTHLLQVCLCVCVCVCVCVCGGEGGQAVED
jgi:hypothetical protein